MDAPTDRSTQGRSSPEGYASHERCDEHPLPQEVDTTLHVVTLPPLGVQWVCVWCNGDNVTISTLLY